MAGSAKEIRWERFPRVKALAEGKKWLEIQHTLGLATNTIEAYARGLDDFLRWCKKVRVDAVKAGRAEVAGFIGDLRTRPSPRGANVVSIESGVGLSNATMQQRLTAIRLFFDYLIEEGHRETNPVGRGRYTAGKGFGIGKRERGLLPRRKKLPWIPNDEEWRRLLDEARGETIRNRCMLALAYDAGLRREELCGLASTDIQPAHRLLRIRAETSKSYQDRIVPYSETTGVLLAAYLEHRRGLSRKRGPLFLSESRRNRTEPITLWTWSKVVRRIANAAELPQFSTHTLRHLCLTDLARAGWDLHEIARFAGHRNVSVTQQYIHLSGRDLAEKLAKGMAQVHEWRARQIHDLSETKENA
ncbi:MAG TPA: integrase [Chloroflexi bacterium]|nr:integrase [Chloroflexota bacterium]